MASRLFRLILACVLALSLSPAPTNPPARALASMTFTVNSTVDEPDATPGDGVCAATPSGACTLRAAIMEANALPGPDTVILPAGLYRLTRGEDSAGPIGGTSAGGDLDITSEIVLRGASARTTRVAQDVAYLSDRNGRLLEVSPEGSADITGVSFFGGWTRWSQHGAGIANYGRLRLRDSELRSNYAVEASGGGLFNGNLAELENVTIAHNETRGTYYRDVGGPGGGIANGLGATLTLRNVTLHENLSDMCGGAVYNEGTVSIVNVTLSGNAGCRSEGLSIRDSIHNQGRLQIQNSIVTRDGGNNCSGQPIESLGHNVENGDTCRLAGPADLSNADPKLGPLGDNGGPTDTRALLPGSPAIDRGRDAACPPTDQRGAPRPRDGNLDGNVSCDIGAYEMQEAVSPDLAVTLAMASLAYPPYAIPGSTLSVDVSVQNGGAVPATGVQLTLSHPGALFRGVVPADSACAPSGPAEVRCALGTLAVGQSRSVRIDLAVAPSVGPGGRVTLTARASAAEPEANLADNSRTIVVEVVADPCMPRPPVRVEAVPEAPGRLRVAVSFPQGSRDFVQFRALRLGQLENARVEYGGRTYGSGEEVSVGAYHETLWLTVVRQTPGRAAHAPFTVSDSCGDWPSFVGGGPTAF